MLTKRENFMQAIRGGHPDRFVNQYEPFAMLVEPIFFANAGPAGPGEPDASDGFGVTFAWPEGQPGCYPVHTPDKIVLKDIEHWRDYVSMPQYKFSEAEWEPWIAEMEKVDRSEQFACAYVLPGIFEECHHLMGVSEALMALYENPDELKELIALLTEWELHKAEEICSHLHPDALFHHDDWGSKDATFMAPEMFAEFFLEPYKQVYGYWRDHGVEVIVHHSDSYAATLVPYMVEMGIDVWQGVMTGNDIPALIDRYGGQISFMGGLENSRLDVPGWTVEAIERDVAAICEACGPRYFVPCLCAGGDESAFPGVYDATTQAIADFSRAYFASHGEA